MDVQMTELVSALNFELQVQALTSEAVRSTDE